MLALRWHVEGWIFPPQDTKPWHNLSWHAQDDGAAVYDKIAGRSIAPGHGGKSLSSLLSAATTCLAGYIMIYTSQEYWHVDLDYARVRPRPTTYLTSRKGDVCHPNEKRATSHTKWRRCGAAFESVWPSSETSKSSNTIPAYWKNVNGEILLRWLEDLKV